MLWFVDKKTSTRGRKPSVIRPVVSVRMDGSFDQWLTAKAEAMDRSKSWILKKIIALGRQQYEDMTNTGNK